MADVKEKPKKSKSVEEFKDGFDVPVLSAKKEKFDNRIKEIVATYRSMQKLIDQQTDFGGPSKEFVAAKNKLEAVRGEYNDLITKTNLSKTDEQKDKFKKLLADSKKLAESLHKKSCEDFDVKLKQHRDKGEITDNDYAALHQLRKSDDPRFQKKAANALYQCEWKKIDPLAGAALKPLDDDAYEACFMAIGEKDLSIQSAALAPVYVEAVKAAAPDRLDFKAAVHGAKSVISQAAVLKKEFDAKVAKCQPSITLTMSTPEKQLNALWSRVVEQQLKNEPRLTDPDFKKAQQLYEAAKLEVKNKKQRVGEAYMQAGLKEYAKLFGAWKTCEETAATWKKTQGDRQKKKAVVTAIIIEANRQAKNQAFDASIGTKAAQYLQAVAAIENVDPGKTLKGKLILVAAWDAQKTTLNQAFQDLTSLYTKQLNPKPADEWKASEQKNGPNGSEAVVKRIYTNVTPTGCKLKLLAAKQQNVQIPDDITLAEVGAIAAYTDDTTCRKLNGILNGIREDDTDQDKQDFEALKEVISTAIAKLPHFPTSTSRGESVWAGAIERYQLNNVFTINAFWSTSFGNQFPGVFQLTIKPKAQGAGRDIQMMSELPGENEVVFPPGSEFKVVGVQGTVAEGRVNVSLEET
jgi:hypothetical protein